MTLTAPEIQTLLQLIRGKILQLPVKKNLKDLFLEDLVRAVDCLARDDFAGLNTVLTLLSSQISKIRNSDSSRTNTALLLKEIHALQQLLLADSNNTTHQPLPDPTSPLSNPVFPPGNNPEYGFFYNLGPSQNIGEEQAVSFDTHGPLSENVSHTPGQAEITIGRPGIYQVHYFLTCAEANSVFELCLNQSPLPGSRLRQVGPTPLQGHCLVALGIPGNLILKNSGRPTRLGYATGRQNSVDASLTLVKLADLPAAPLS